MAFLQELQAAAAWVGWYILPFVVVMTAIVFFHELGHYLVGRWCGVKIDAFSLGFGPELYARVDKRGTRWRLAAIPVGGYVKFHGDANAASAPDVDGVAAMTPAERARTLAGQPLANRAAIVAAGPLANFVLAVAIFAALFVVFGRAEQTPRIGARRAGLARRRGRIPGRAISSRRSTAADRHLRGLAAGDPAQHRPADELRRRAGGSRNAPRRHAGVAVVDQGPLGKRRMGRLGLVSSRSSADVRIERCGPPACLVWGAQQVGFIVEATGAYVGGLIAGRETADNCPGRSASA